ncbi:alpha/beta fold hydrolase [Actinoplanes oblitus]|uniref:Alpha/beta fold hydrolase n=1 Tax=Actinoplanes oblitus TaxID=3040509 RepID=A0ABY8WSH3_9ACTN|nr:alpha/beta fold hydrolase [Actinoplanes oblitus]WIN00584.1 alpha/beta fold hydrolase [Actinoplanes oblitus]
MTTTAETDSRAAEGPLRRFAVRRHAQARLVCLPHAGGSAGQFRRWAVDAPWDVEILVAQYPGREDRYGEPAHEAMPALVAELLPAVMADRGSSARRPTVLFGHSMGASVAYELACRLTALGDPPAGLIVSGQPGPARLRRTRLHTAGDDELIADLTRLRGTGEAVLRDRAMLGALLPAIRSDYRVIETYRPPVHRPLGIPVTALRAGDDPEADAEEVRAWREVTTGRFQTCVLPGDHFALLDPGGPALARTMSAVRAAVGATVSSTFAP